MLFTAAYDQSTTFDLFAFEAQPVVIEPDDDWLEVEFHIKKENLQWDVTDACLTAAEVFKLAKWMRDVATGMATARELHFWEPILSFELSYDYGKSKLIKITFDGELKPGWCDKDEPYTQLCHAGNRQLMQCADLLVAELKELYGQAGIKMAN